MNAAQESDTEVQLTDGMHENNIQQHDRLVLRQQPYEASQELPHSQRGVVTAKAGDSNSKQAFSGQRNF